MAKKLTDSEVLAIRQSAARGVSRKELQMFYGVNVETIARIVRGDSHQHVNLVTVAGEQQFEAERAKALPGEVERLLRLQESLKVAGGETETLGRELTAAEKRAVELGLPVSKLVR